MKFTVLHSKQAEKFLKKTHPIEAKRIAEKFTILQTTPVPGDAGRLQGPLGEQFRWRIGNYRVLYEIYYNNKTIIIVNIERRESAY